MVGRQPSARPSRPSDRNLRPAPDTRLDPKDCADVFGALAHDVEPVVTRRTPLGVAPLTIIGDAQHDFIGITDEIDLDRRGFRVLEGIVHGFPGDPLQVQGHVLR